MGQLSRVARGYLVGSYLLGLAALVWLIQSSSPLLASPRLLALAAGLLALAAVAQILVVMRAGSSYSDRLTPVPLFAAFLLLPPALLAIVVVLAFLPEWRWYRRQWHLQSFTIAAWAVALALGRGTLFLLTGHKWMESAYPYPVQAVALALLVVLTTQTLLLVGVLWVTRGQTLAETGLFAPSKLFVEATLLCVGWVLAAAWLVDPFYGVVALAPLALIFQALHVPNLKVEASTDPKTGLANIRYFDDVLERNLGRSRRSGQPFSLLMCDLDDLRRINNTYDHLVGDAVIAAVATTIRDSIRGCDLAARFGGDEFCILLADSEGNAARVIAERVREAAEHVSVRVGRSGQTVRTTMCIGVANYPLHGSTPETLLREADLAMYQGKRDGGNRVVLAGSESQGLAAEWNRPSRDLARNDQVREVDPLRRFVNEATRSLYADDRLATPPTGRSAGPVGQLPPPGRVEPPDGRILAFVGLVVVLGMLSVFVDGSNTGRPLEIPWVGLALFAALTVLAEQFAVVINQRSKTSVTVTVVLAATILFGAPGALATATAFAVWAKIKGHSPLHRMLFNWGMVLAAAEMGRWTFEWLTGGLRSGKPFELLLAPAVVAGLAYYVVNHLFLSIVRGLGERRPPGAVWRDNYRWIWPHYAVFGALALVVSVGYEYLGWAGVTALMSPVAMMHLAIKHYMDRTTIYVDELERLNARLGDSYDATLLALTRALDTRDDETEEHSQRVRRYTELIAHRMSLASAEVEHLGRGALLHDIGKIGVPDAILRKPGPLTDDERRVMQRHPVIGHGMISDIPFLAPAAEIVLHHHEAYNGSGYPIGLAGERIPLGARIFAVADTLDAMTSNRPYRRALSYAVALAEIERCRGTQFDPAIVDIILDIPVADLRACATIPTTMAEEQLSQSNGHGPAGALAS